MYSLFQIAPNDVSVQSLVQIFGYVGTVLPTQTTAPPMLLGIMFQVINTMALTLGAIMVVYVTVVGLLATAHEGEFMGKKWSGLWVPLRTVFGIAALFPTGSGYSAIQIIFMWIILQGVGAADVLWTTVLKYVSVTGSPFSSVNSSSVNQTAVSSSFNTLFQALVCQASAQASYPDIPLASSTRGVSYYCNTNNKGSSDPFCASSNTSQNMLNILVGGPQVATNGTLITYSIGPSSSGGGACGSLQYTDPAQYCNGSTASNAALNCAASKAAQQALQQTVTTFGAIAQAFVAADNQYVTFYETAGAKPPSFMQSYCAAQNPAIPTAQCCVIPATGSGQTCNGFSNVSDTMKSSPTNIENVDPNTVANVYLPYVLTPVLQGDFISSAVSNYTSYITTQIAGYMAANLSSQPTALSGWMTKAQAAGWLQAGSYYYNLASMNQQNQNAANQTLAVNGSEPISQGTALSKYRNNYIAAGAVLSGTASQSSANIASAPGSGAVSLALTVAGSSLLSSFINSMSSNSSSGGSAGSVTNTDPLVSIAAFGYSLMVSAQFLFAAILIIMVPIIVFSTMNFMAVGTGMTLEPVGEAIKSLFSFVSPFVVLLISTMFTLGAMLGIYVPLIPYVIFIMGVIGWFVATIEAMVAAPLVALGILSPGGQHEILGRAEPALMLIFNTFLRPSLMIFGLMTSMLLSVVVISVINMGFLNITSQIISSPGLFEELFFIAAYTSLIVSALNKVFSLIYYIPERVLTWIGGPAVQYGEAEATSAMKHAVEGAAGASAGAGKESGSAASAGAWSTRKAKEDKAEKAKPGASAAAKKSDPPA